MSLMRKLDVFIRENKGVDQLCSNCTLHSTSVFATGIVQFLFYLYPKYQASMLPCIREKSGKLIFSRSELSGNFVSA